MEKYKVVAERVALRRPGSNEAIYLGAGSLIPIEILKKYKQTELDAHVKAGRIELIEDGNIEDEFNFRKNKKMPRGREK